MALTRNTLIRIIYEVLVMNSIHIYMILLAIYLFQIASHINNKYKKSNYYKGWLFVGSLLCFLLSIYCVLIK